MTNKMTKKEAEIRVLDFFDLFRPDDVTDHEWLTAKVIFGLIEKAGQSADSYILSLEQGYTDEQMIATLELEAIEYKPRIKAWIVDQMR